MLLLKYFFFSHTKVIMVPKLYEQLSGYCLCSKSLSAAPSPRSVHIVSIIKHSTKQNVALAVSRAQDTYIFQFFKAARLSRSLTE